MDVIAEIRRRAPELEAIGIDVERYIADYRARTAPQPDAATIARMELEAEVAAARSNAAVGDDEWPEDDDRCDPYPRGYRPRRYYTGPAGDDWTRVLGS